VIEQSRGEDAEHDSARSPESGGEHERKQLGFIADFADGDDEG
jgi:hypothetical protein